MPNCHVNIVNLRLATPSLTNGFQQFPAKSSISDTAVVLNTSLYSNRRVFRILMSKSLKKQKCLRSSIFSKVVDFRPALNIFTWLLLETPVFRNSYFLRTSPIAACYNELTKTGLLHRYFARILQRFTW